MEGAKFGMMMREMSWSSGERVGITIKTMDSWEWVRHQNGWYLGLTKVFSDRNEEKSYSRNL
jgi:hypothetical protein